MKTLRRVLLEGRKKGTNRRGVGVHGVTDKDAKRARENVLAQNELRRRAGKARQEREDSQDGRLSPETNASVYRAQAGADQKFMRMVGLSTQRVGPPSKRGDAARKLQLQRDTDAIRKRPAPHEISSSRVYPLTLPMISERVAKTARDIERAQAARREGRRRGNPALEAYGKGQEERIERGRSAARDLAQGARRSAHRSIARGARGTRDTQQLTGPLVTQTRGKSPSDPDEDRTPIEKRLDRSFRTLGRQITKEKRRLGEKPAPGPNLP